MEKTLTAHSQGRMAGSNPQRYRQRYRLVEA